MLLFAASLVPVAACILLLFLCILALERPSIVLFIDAPDPDNPAAAVALWSYLLKKKRGHLHVVLTGRPVNLRTGKCFSENLLVKKPILRQTWETTVPEHVKRVLEDSARGIAGYLTRCGVPLDSFTIYDGGVARAAPLSDATHDWDFLFDRRDLVTQRREDEGEILDPAEYRKLLDKYCTLDERERERTLFAILRRYNLSPLDKLRSHLSKPWNRKFSVFLGGPATAMVKLFKQTPCLSRKVTSVYAMFGSLCPGKGTLLPNQFNAACDIQAAKEAFVENQLFPGVVARFVTTETAKLSTYVLSAQEMAERGVNDHVVRLQVLWEWTHGNQPQPMFDVLPVMATLPTHKDSFTWLRKKPCIVKSDHGEIFTLADTTDSTDTSTVLVTDSCSNIDRESFIQFFVQIW